MDFFVDLLVDFSVDFLGGEKAYVDLFVDFSVDFILGPLFRPLWIS